MFALFKTGSPPLEIVRGTLKTRPARLPFVTLSADRWTLAKRRWRGRATDGREFGFDLEQPLRHGDVFFRTDTHGYSIDQVPEPVLRLDLGSPDAAARLAWQVGNLHFPVMLHLGCLLVEDDPALRHLFERNQTPFTAMTAIFEPLAGAPGHHHP